LILWIFSAQVEHNTAGSQELKVFDVVPQRLQEESAGGSAGVFNFFTSQEPS